MTTLEFFFDCSSPWTYIGFHNIQPLAAEFGVPITWKPILVGGVFNAVNPSVYASRENPIPAKEAYRDKDIADWARHAGIVVRWKPPVFPVNSVKAMRGCIVAGREGRLVDMARACFTAYWTDHRDISQDDVLADICAAIGFDKDTFFKGIANSDVKNELRDNTEDLIKRGGFGSPTIFVGGDDMYFGNDRLPLIRDALARASA
jgi:2-hydroxychromene-2-carboxylate isomerase